MHVCKREMEQEMAGLTLGRVQHHLTQVTCCAAFVGHPYVTRVSLCVRARIKGFYKRLLCMAVSATLYACVLERRRVSCDAWAWWRWGLPPPISIALHHLVPKSLSWWEASTVPVLSRGHVFVVLMCGGEMQSVRFVFGWIEWSLGKQVTDIQVTLTYIS